MYYDYLFGTENEKVFIDVLKSKFGENVKQVKNKLCTYDYENDEYIFELKTRRNEKLKYPTTIVGYDKIKSYSNIDKKIIFCFQFTDCTSFYEYDVNDKLEVKKAGRRDRGKPEIKDYLFIPVEKLIDF